MTKIKQMQSSLYLLHLTVAQVEKPKKFKYSLIQTLHFDGDEVQHLKE
jgi:hypothetical protein